MGNLWHKLPVELPDELFTVLIEQPNLRIERIVSRGHSSPAVGWYDQAWDEWVVVLKGEGRLQFTDRDVHLGPGDYLHIPAGERHRVEWTHPTEPTVWLAIHYVATPPPANSEQD